MSQPLLVAADLVAIGALVGIYFVRYHRRDMLVAILGLNVGVMAVATALSTTEVSAGLGLGLFGVLSIIRLRSSELAQEEVAYYFTALALGLLGGIAVSPAWVTPSLMVAIIVTLFVGDHPRLFARNRHQIMTIDRAFTSESALKAHLEQLLGGEVLRLSITKVNLVNDSTTVDVRFRLGGDIDITSDPWATNLGVDLAVGARQ